MSLSKHQAEAIVFKQGYLFKDNQKKYLNVIFNKVDQIKQIPQSKIQTKHPIKKYLSINEILARYPIGKTKLFKLIKDHNISTIKGIGGRGIAPTMVDVEELEEVFYKLNSSKLGTKYPH